MLPETRYAKSGDVHIAYQVIGNGPIDLVFVPGFITGLSDRVPAIPTLEERMDDVRAVMDAVGFERAALFGVSEGGPMSILFAATYPERTIALVMYGAYAKRAWAEDHRFGWRDEEWDALFANIEGHWGTPRGLDLNIWAPSMARDERARGEMTAYLRAAASPGA